MLARWDNIPATRVVPHPGEFGYAYLDEGARRNPRIRPSWNARLREPQTRSSPSGSTPPSRFWKSLNPGGQPAGMSSEEPELQVRPAPLPANADGALGGYPLPRRPPAVRVPNIGADTIDPTVVEDNGDWLHAVPARGRHRAARPRGSSSTSRRARPTCRAQGKLVALFTATTGSTNDPLPLGEWSVLTTPRTLRLNTTPTCSARPDRTIRTRTPAGAKRPRRRGLDRPQQGALRHPRHARSGDIGRAEATAACG